MFYVVGVRQLIFRNLFKTIDTDPHRCYYTNVYTLVGRRSNCYRSRSQILRGKGFTCSAVSGQRSGCDWCVERPAGPNTMNLMCTESQTTSEDKCFAEDRTIFRDERAVKKLLETESQYVPDCDYMAHPQSNLQPFMRRVVATWMLDVGSVKIISQ